MSEDETDSKMAAFLKDHPRMMGTLFTLLVLITQSGVAVAEGCGGTCGP